MAPTRKEKRSKIQRKQLSNVLLALLLVGAASGLSELLHNFFDPTNLVMIYLLATIIASVYLGLFASILVAVLGVLVFDFLFIPPFLTFAVASIQYLFSLIALLAVGITISYLTAQFRRQAEMSRQRERQMTALYSLGRDLAIAIDLDSYIKAILFRTRETFEKVAIVFLPDPQKKTNLKSYSENSDIKIAENDDAAALWAFQHQKIIGHGTETLSDSRARYYPLITARGIVGVMALFETDVAKELSFEEERLIEAYADLSAVAIEGILLAQELRNTEILKASEKLQTALLNSISHDLRTPLVSIIGALSSLQEEEINLDDSARQNLVQVAREEAERLNRLITNLLDESRLAAGIVKINLQPAEIQDLVETALEQLGTRTASHSIKTNMVTDLPFVAVDFALIVQVLVNILDNAIKYSPSGSLVEISGQRMDKAVVISIADRGIGIPPPDLEHIFDKFYRVHRPDRVSGTGLGLSISKGIMEAHGGEIAAENRPDGGTILRLTFPAFESGEEH